MPQAFTSWEAIYETLRAAFPNERYHMGATLVGSNDTGDGQAVSAKIEGHGQIKTDLLVCADGHSRRLAAGSCPTCNQSTRAMSPGAARSTKRMRQKTLCAFSRTPSPSQRPARAGTS
jgi:2-polyprenyl-6-methoxyphenol hydroxylase-like FAD-dependent oxidoreductase